MDRKYMDEFIHLAMHLETYTLGWILVLGFTIVIFSIIIITCICKCLCKTQDRKTKSVNRSSLNQNSENIGSNCNIWRFRIFETGSNDNDVVEFFRTKKINFDYSLWEESCEVIDKVMKHVVRQMKMTASGDFPGLVLEDNLIKQGSSREGLKVCDPFEFDYILPFRIEGLTLTKTAIYDCCMNKVPGLFKYKIQNSCSNIPSWMENHDVIGHSEDGYGSGRFINTRNFQRKLFTSLVDKSISGLINKNIHLPNSKYNRYSINRSVDPPTLKITIRVEKSFGLRGLNMSFQLESRPLSEDNITIDVDLVPAMVLANDFIPDPYTVNNFHQSPENYPKGWCRKLTRIFSSSEVSDTTEQGARMMHCIRYGVMKWVNKKNPAIGDDEKDMLWRESTCGYEKHIFDIARRSQSQRYVMTACRLLKGALSKFPSDSTEQLGSVLKSYHLKHITLYCILFLTIPREENKLSSVREALGYFVNYLELSLNVKNLPHFFYGNPWLGLMLPGSPFEREKVKYNLLATTDPETLRQARCSLSRFLQTLEGLYYKDWLLDNDKINRFRDLLK
ncbi:uncharacterized protein [Magallana gigas]|uniref:uncharacterized protein n=1 Tax=Magallana gigas TaxID=29159 RepID=UPI00333F8BDF